MHKFKPVNNTFVERFKQGKKTGQNNNANQNNANGNNNNGANVNPENDSGANDPPQNDPQPAGADGGSGEEPAAQPQHMIKFE